jgi:M6 family metalloprotease-like protein
MASAQPVSECRIKASSIQMVSIGFPVNPPRLANIVNPKILVIPYQLKDDKTLDFGAKEKENFIKASENIYNFSNGKSKVTFVYNAMINIDMTVKERDAIKQPQNNNKTWQERYDDSTWGFMKRLITDQDRNIDYSGFDGVILYSKSSVVSAENAEAMLMTKDLYGPWFNPISTAEGEIHNVVVLYNNDSEYTVTHEVLHLFGLSDLYGTQFGPANSLMKSSKYMSILAWEKWVLGWLGDDNVQCISENDLTNSQNANNTFTLDYSVNDQLLVMPTGEKTALVVDVITSENRTFLNYYSIDNDARPPIKTFNKATFEGTSVEVTKNQGIGTYLQSTKMGILIGDNDGKKLTISVFPIQLFFSESAKQLQATAENNRLKYLKLAEQQAAASSKKTTITCVKGKLTKKVTAVKPVCPKGYKKK